MCTWTISTVGILPTTLFGSMDAIALVANHLLVLGGDAHSAIRHRDFGEIVAQIGLDQFASGGFPQFRDGLFGFFGGRAKANR
jgi:hypothetical protein